MKIEQTNWTQNGGWAPRVPTALGSKAQLVFVFAERSLFQQTKEMDHLRTAYPRANFLGCSTAGEICGTRVHDNSIVSTAVQFEHSSVRGVQALIQPGDDGFRIGSELAAELDPKGLVHVFVLSDGLKVNGSALVKGLASRLPKNVTITGGLSGDGSAFAETVVLWNREAASGSVVALGLYGDLKVGFGSLGGWDTFGPNRLVTKSKGSVLYELDGESALDVYKKYLGEHAKGLPATGLLFPLCLTSSERPEGVVRTILAINEEEKSITFAGDIPEGSYAKLMKANFDRLIDGAVGAAKTSYEALGSNPADLAILISCVGRKLILKQRIEEEVEAVAEIQGENTVLAGFYSYGEIAPFMPNAKCELHNQTMTITTLSERAA